MNYTPVFKKKQPTFRRLFFLGSPTDGQKVVISHDGEVVYENTRAQLETWWSETSYRVQRLRDNADCADQEYKKITDNSDLGLSSKPTAKLLVNSYSSRPKVAIFREQGVNGHVEMAAAFDKAGFTSVDVHLNDIVSGLVSLDDFVGLVACGGFSYGDVLGAGEGWAKTILSHEDLRAKFSRFFVRKNTFTLGVCNGCQMLSALKELIPGAETWPKFLKNKSEQFEARLVMTYINDSPSIFFKGMSGSYLPVPVAHGEGRAVFDSVQQADDALKSKLAPMQYTDGSSNVTEQYPANPNGSYGGITALTTPDGRATIMMPHPERAFMTRQLSWHPSDWGSDSPWLRIFQNSRKWVEDSTP